MSSIRCVYGKTGGLSRPCQNHYEILKYYNIRGAGRWGGALTELEYGLWPFLGGLRPFSGAFGRFWRPSAVFGEKAGAVSRVGEALAVSGLEGPRAAPLAGLGCDAL